MSIDNEHINDFLKEFPKKKNPFKTPDNYFQQLSDKIVVDVIEDQLPKTSGFKTPNMYFENFVVKKPQRKIISLIPYISVAAVALIGLFIFNNNNSSVLDEINSEDIISYLSIDDDVNTNYIMDNTIINTNNMLFTSLNDINIDIDHIDIELSEYDILEY